MLDIRREDITSPIVELVNSIAQLIWDRNDGDIDNAVADFMDNLHNSSNTLPKLIEDSIRMAEWLYDTHEDTIVPLWVYARIRRDSALLESYSLVHECTSEDFTQRLKELCHEFYN